MANPPVLTGPRVRLRMPRVEDAEAMFTGMASDPEVSRYMSWTPHPDVAETRHVITDVFNVGADPTWLIEWRDTGEFVGTCGWIRPRPNTVEWGTAWVADGGGRESWRRWSMCWSRRLGRDPTVYRVTAYCHVDNVGSAGVLRRCGLTLEGRLARYAVFPNLGPEPQDCLMYGKAVR